MGNTCCCPSSQAHGVELFPAAEPHHVELKQQAEPPAAHADASGVVEALLESYLPELATQIGHELSEGNDKGGLPIGGPYSLHINRAEGDTRPMGAELIEELSVGIEDVKIAPGRFRDDGRGVVTRVRHAKQDSSFSPTVVLELTTSLHLRLGKSGLDLKLKGDAWWSPSVSVEVEWLKVRAKLRLIWAVKAQTLSIAFLEQPEVQWDIEMRLFMVGMPLPSWLEDHLPALAVSKLLASRSPDKPFVVRMNPEQPSKAGEEKVRFVLDAGQGDGGGVVRTVSQSGAQGGVIPATQSA